MLRLAQKSIYSKIMYPADETGSGINAQLIKIWMNNEHFVQKVLVKSDSGSDLEFRFTGCKINPGLADSDFTFNPPKGIKIIDLR